MKSPFPIAKRRISSLPPQVWRLWRPRIPTGAGTAGASVRLIAFSGSMQALKRRVGNAINLQSQPLHPTFPHLLCALGLAEPRGAGVRFSVAYDNFVSVYSFHRTSVARCTEEL